MKSNQNNQSPVFLLFHQRTALDGVKSILSECWKKYNDPQTSDQDKIECMELALEC